MRAMMSQNREIESLLDDDIRVRMLRGIFDSYYAGFPDQSIVFDTNQAWSIRIPHA